MKTITAGKVPKGYKPWSLGERVSCAVCGFVGQLEATDLLVPILSSGTNAGTAKNYVTFCPCCGTPIVVLRK